MHIHSPAYVQNHVHFALAQKNPKSQLVYSKKVITIVKILSDIGCIHRFLITQSTFNHRPQLLIWLSIFMYNNTAFFKSLRLLSTPSRQYTITYKALRILTTSIGASTIVLSTSLGLITHQKALCQGIGGLLLFILS